MMSKWKKRALPLLSFVFAVSVALCVLFWGGPVTSLAAVEADPIVTTFSEDMGAWASDPGSTASTEIAYDEKEGGYLKMTLTGGSPSLVLDGISLDSTQYTAMVFRVRYQLQNPTQMAHPSLGNRFSIYVGSDTVGYGSALYWPSVAEEVQDTEWHTIVVDLTDTSLAHPDYAAGTKWDGTVTKFRLDPIWSEKQYYEPGDAISIDFIKFYSDKATAEAEIASGWEDDATVNARGSENYFNFTRDAEDWEFANCAQDSGWAETGELKVVLGDSDPQLTHSWGIGVSLDEYKYLAFKMKNDTAGAKSKIYFSTKSSGVYDEAKTGTVAVTPSSDYAVYVFDMSENASWTGVLKNLRFDVIDDADNNVSSGTVLIDWMGFYKTQEEIPAVSVEDDDMTLPEGPVVEFSFTDSTENWQGNADVTLTNNYSALQLVMEEGADDPNITYSFTDGLDTTVYPVLQIKMRNRTAGTKLSVYYEGKDAQIDGTKYADFTVSADDTVYKIYTFNMASVGSWGDEPVYTLRIDPSDKGGGEILIDYIRFYRSMDEAETNGEYEDDATERPNAHTEFNFNLYNSYWKNASSDNADVECKDGSMVVTLKDEAPMVEYEYEQGDYSDWAEGIDAKSWNYLVMKIRVTSERESVAGKLQFRRNLVGSRYEDGMTYEYEVTPGEWELVQIDLQSNHFWNSTVSALRLYPVTAGVAGEVAEVDYIKFYRSEDDILIDGDDYEDDPTDEEAISYFDFRDPSNRFDEARASHGTVAMTENGMETTITGQDPVLMHSYVYDGVGLNADEYKFMKISVKNESTATMFEFFWDCMDSEGTVTTWGSTTNFTIETMSANDTEYKEYIIDFSAKEDWTGTILRLRYDPAGWLNETDVSGKVTTRYIKFYKTAEEAALDNPWGEEEPAPGPDDTDPNDPSDPGAPGDPSTPGTGGDVTFTDWKRNPLSIVGIALGAVGLAMAAVCVVLILKK